MIRDQRSMYGGPNLATVAEVEAFWEQALALVSAQRGETITLHDETDVLTAYVNEGRWVAKCPVDNGGIACWPDNPKGVCLDCGSRFDVEFPDTATIEAADAVLSSRRLAAHRNWYPGEETVLRLQVENVLLGEVPEDFAGVVRGDGTLMGATEMLDEYQALLTGRFAAELGSGSEGGV